MTTILKYNNDKLPLIDAVVSKLKASHKAEWNEEGNKLIGTLKDSGSITIEFPPDFEGEFIVEVDEKTEPWLKALILKESMVITQKDIDDSVFKGISLLNIKGGDMFLLNKNITVFNELKTYFKGLKINSVGFGGYPKQDYYSYTPEKLTMVIAPYDVKGNGTNINSDAFSPYKNLSGYKMPNANGMRIEPTPGEKIDEIKLGTHIIGTYYKERNLILLNINPWHNINLKEVYTYKDNEFLKKFMEDFSKIIKSFKPKSVNVDNIKTKMVIAKFNSRSKQRLSSIQKDLKRTQKSIHEYEESICRMYKISADFRAEIKGLSVIGDDALDMFMEQIQKARKQNIVEKVELGDSTVNITYRPTSVKAHLGRNIEGHTDEGPIYEMFTGRITAHLNADGKITISSDYPKGNYPHPHANNSGLPCLGDSDSDAPVLMRKLIGEHKFADFIYVFWMWIKRWRPEDCYIPPHEYFDDRLKHGLPVFDQTGKRVIVNDPDEIKKGIQNELTLASDHDKNIKLWKDFKSQT